MVRPPPFSDKMNAKKRAWAEEEDVKILSYVSKHGTGDGNSVPRKPESSSELKKCGKSCRIRWTNNPKAVSSHEGFRPDEEELIIKLHAAVGSRWPIIAHQLPGRTEHDIKNYWNTKLRKKLTQMGIDPITHKPFSQILADYGNIGGLSRATCNSRYIGTIKKDLKKVTSFTPAKSEPYSSPSYTFISNSHLSHTFSPLPENYANHEINNTNTSHSLDLLSQLQAISLVTELSDTNNNFAPLEINQLPFGNLSASACSANYHSDQVLKSPESFSWHDFLLDDTTKLAQRQEQEQMLNSSEYNDIGRGFSSIQPQPQAQASAELNCYRIHAASSSSLTSSDTSTFLEAMLDQENDMFLNFPGLMEEPLY